MWFERQRTGLWPRWSVTAINCKQVSTLDLIAMKKVIFPKRIHSSCFPDPLHLFCLLTPCLFVWTFPFDRIQGLCFPERAQTSLPAHLRCVPLSPIWMPYHHLLLVSTAYSSFMTKVSSLVLLQSSQTTLAHNFLSFLNE